MKKKYLGLINMFRASAQEVVNASNDIAIEDKTLDLWTKTIFNYLLTNINNISHSDIDDLQPNGTTVSIDLEVPTNPVTKIPYPVLNHCYAQLHRDDVQQKLSPIIRWRIFADSLTNFSVLQRAANYIPQSIRRVGRYAESGLKSIFDFVSLNRQALLSLIGIVFEAYIFINDPARFVKMATPIVMCKFIDFMATKVVGLQLRGFWGTLVHYFINSVVLLIGYLSVSSWEQYTVDVQTLPKVEKHITELEEYINNKYKPSYDVGPFSPFDVPNVSVRDELARNIGFRDEIKSRMAKTLDGVLGAAADGIVKFVSSNVVSQEKYMSWVWGGMTALYAFSVYRTRVGKFKHPPNLIKAWNELRSIAKNQAQQFWSTLNRRVQQNVLDSIQKQLQSETELQQYRNELQVMRRNVEELDKLQPALTPVTFIMQFLSLYPKGDSLYLDRLLANKRQAALNEIAESKQRQYATPEVLAILDRLQTYLNTNNRAAETFTKNDVSLYIAFLSKERIPVPNSLGGTNIAVEDRPERKMMTKLDEEKLEKDAVWINNEDRKSCTIMRREKPPQIDTAEDRGTKRRKGNYSLFEKPSEATPQDKLRHEDFLRAYDIFEKIIERTHWKARDEHINSYQSYWLFRWMGPYCSAWMGTGNRNANAYMSRGVNVVSSIENVSMFKTKLCRQRFAFLSTMLQYPLLFLFVRPSEVKEAFETSKSTISCLSDALTSLQIEGAPLGAGYAMLLLDNCKPGHIRIVGRSLSVNGTSDWVNALYSVEELTTITENANDWKFSRSAILTSVLSKADQLGVKLLSNICWKNNRRPDGIQDLPDESSERKSYTNEQTETGMRYDVIWKDPTDFVDKVIKGIPRDTANPSEKLFGQYRLSNALDRMMMQSEKVKMAAKELKLKYYPFLDSRNDRYLTTRDLKQWKDRVQQEDSGKYADGKSDFGYFPPATTTPTNDIDDEFKKVFLQVYSPEQFDSFKKHTSKYLTVENISKIPSFNPGRSLIGSPFQTIIVHNYCVNPFVIMFESILPDEKMGRTPQEVYDGKIRKIETDIAEAQRSNDADKESKISGYRNEIEEAKAALQNANRQEEYQGRDRNYRKYVVADAWFLQPYMKHLKANNHNFKFARYTDLQSWFADDPERRSYLESALYLGKWRDMVLPGYETFSKAEAYAWMMSNGQ
jgi:hypothetical protein